MKQQRRPRICRCSKGKYPPTRFLEPDMQSTQMTWEDTSNDRDIDLEVKWRMTAEGISIADVIPTRVLLRSEKTPGTTIGVHTPGGRRMLNRLIDHQSVAANIAERELAWA